MMLILEIIDMDFLNNNPTGKIEVFCFWHALIELISTEILVYSRKCGKN